MTKLKGKSPEVVKPGHLKCVIFGESGVGKTWLSLMFPKPYFIDTEGGAKLKHYQNRLEESDGAYFGPEDGAGDFGTIIHEMHTLASEKHEFKTLVIDSLTKPYNTIISNEAERLGDKNAFAADKKPAIAKVRGLINAMDRLDMNTFIICHEKAKWAGGEQAGWDENIWDGLRYEIDLTLRIVRQAGKRFAIVCKSRLLGFPDGDRFEATYEEIVARYGKDYIEANSIPVELATIEQVKEVENLLAVLKVEDKEIDKWHLRAKADSFSEYRTEDLNKLIIYLKSKIK